MLWLITFALLAQDPVDGTITFDSSLELETVVRDGKGESTRLLTLNRKEKFRQRKVDAKSVKIECLNSTVQKSGSDILIEEKPTALAGQSYVATRTETGWVASDPDGGAPPAEGQNLGAWNSIGTLLPANAEVKAGDKWTVESKDLLPLIFPTSIRDASGKLECSCESVEGGKAGVVFTGQITGRSKDDMQAQITLTIKAGRLTYDLAKKAPVSLLFSGSFESNMDIVDVIRKPGTGTTIGNQEERRKMGEISIKSRKLEMSL
ncbi:MAG TPA: hypothetical protein VKU80_12465, partial [Planctomycetota bacterium]|nr:hypothetical protein [Planctomycetota bacterium]